MAAAVNGPRGLGRWRTVADGLVRTVGRTAGALALDVANAGLRGVEAAGDRLSGSPRGPGVVRVRVVILSDEHGPLLSPEAVVPALVRADEIFRAAGLRVRAAGTEVIAPPAPPEALRPRANRDLLVDDILGRTLFYRDHLPQQTLGLVGAPVTVVVVESIAGRTTGCSLGMTADWVIAEAGLLDRTRPDRYDDTVLAHELGHALNLPHHPDRANLMYPVSSPPGQVRGVGLTRWQAAVLDTNRHTVPGTNSSTVPGTNSSTVPGTNSSTVPGTQ